MSIVAITPHDFTADPYTSKCMYCGRGRDDHDACIKLWKDSNVTEVPIPQVGPTEKIIKTYSCNGCKFFKPEDESWTEWDRPNSNEPCDWGTRALCLNPESNVVVITKYYDSENNTETPNWCPFLKGA